MQKSPGYYLGLGAKIILAIAMLLYLGMHSFNFFSFTFQGSQWLFAVLGLFTTSIGFILWLLIYLYVAEDGLERAVALVMMFVSLLGEFATAGFDMFMNISNAFATQGWTPSDLRNMSYIVAGLALLNGLALVAGVAGQQIMDDLSNVKLPKPGKGNKVSNVNTVTPSVTASSPMVANAAETGQVTLQNKDSDGNIQVSMPPGVYKSFVKSLENNQGEGQPTETPFGKNGR